MIVVRELSGNDWAEWRELRLAALREAPDAFSSTVPGGARLSEVNVLADLDATPAGMVSGHLSGDSAELLSMWVTPDARGRGVGDALVQAMVRWSEGRGAGRLELRIAAGNQHAKALYERHGFVPQPSSDSDELEMIRQSRRE
ncbi:GNAT family N-acetyltransferase [Amycolatopsis jejuensis]|uniref:GNAT family N-acetyltransferase n=1 Tax=Amycolatopsis jejuensis TaxID=330084 RepID=UPI000524E78F|nr:GNAT family N-acetyltransferase [Amycolatopsis jejuensis]